MQLSENAKRSLAEKGFSLLLKNMQTSRHKNIIRHIQENTVVPTTIWIHLQMRSMQQVDFETTSKFSSKTLAPKMLCTIMQSPENNALISPSIVQGRTIFYLERLRIQQVLSWKDVFQTVLIKLNED